MRRIVAFALDALPFDARSRRALDETLLDWAHEERGARTPFMRLVCELRGVLSAIHTTVVSAGSETLRIPFGSVSARLLVFTLVSSVLLGFLPPGVHKLPWTTVADSASFGFVRGTPLTSAPWLALAYLHRAAGLMPVTFLMASCWPGRRPLPPAIGLGLLASATTCLLGGWILPLVDRSFGLGPGVGIWGLGQNVSYYQAIGPALSNGVSVSEQFLREWVRGGDTAFSWLFFVIGPVPLAAAFAVLGSALREHRVRRPWILLAPVVLVSATPLFADLHNRFFVPYPLFGFSFAPWWMTIAALTAVALLRRRSARRGESPDTVQVPVMS